MYVYIYNFLLLTRYVITEQGNWEIQGLDIYTKILQLDKKLALTYVQMRLIEVTTLLYLIKHSPKHLHYENMKLIIQKSSSGI